MMIMGNLRNLSVLGLLALAGATSGCIISSNSHNNQCVSGVDTDWTITDASGSVTLSCAQAGAAFVDLYVDGVRADEVPCTDGVMASSVSPGTHTVQYKLIDVNGNVLSSVPALSAVVPTCGSNSLPSIAFAVSACPDGAVRATWHLETTNGASVQCLPGDTVNITVDSMSAPFPCSNYGGTTPPVSGGVSHNVSLTLLDSTGAVVSQTQTMALLVHCGTTENIGDVPFVTP